MRQYDPPGEIGAGRGIGGDAGDRDPDEIRVEIEQTRTEMSGTIDAIQQRLAPEVLSEQAKDVARDATNQAKTAAQEVLQDAVREVKDAAIEVTEHAVHEVKQAAREATVDAKDAAWDATVGRAEGAVSTVGQTARGAGAIVIETIRQNPIPAALAGLSLYWLYRNRSGGQGFGSAAPTSGTYRATGSYREPRTPQAYPIRTGYASQAERDAMTSPSEVTEAPDGSPEWWTGRQGESDGGVASSAGRMASSAGHLASEAASTAGEMASGVGEMASGVGETALDAGSGILDLIQRNPVPAALVGIGLGWLYLNRSAPRPDYRAHSGSHYRYSPELVAQAYGSGRQGTDTSESSSVVGRVTSQAGDLASSAGDRVGEMAGSMQEQVSDVAGTVVHQTQRAPGQLQRMMEQNPLASAVVAASLGAAVGLWLPPTQTENRLMGPASDRAMGRAQQAASETVEKVQDVAQEVRSTVAEEARAKGLTV